MSSLSIYLEKLLMQQSVFIENVVGTCHLFHVFLWRSFTTIFFETTFDAQYVKGILSVRQPPMLSMLRVSFPYVKGILSVRHVTFLDCSADVVIVILFYLFQYLNIRLLQCRINRSYLDLSALFCIPTYFISSYMHTFACIYM
jgi:hypothetical protein